VPSGVYRRAMGPRKTPLLHPNGSEVMALARGCLREEPKTFALLLNFYTLRGTGYGMAKELGDLTGIGSTTVEKMNRMGIESVDDLGKADASIVNDHDVSISEDRMQTFIETAAREAIIIQTGDEVVEEYENRGCVPTGIPELDEKIGGLENRSLIAVGGSTGAGKTQLGFQACGEAVQKYDEPAVYIETEPDRYRGKRIQDMYDEDIQSKVHKVSVAGEDALDMQYRSYKAVESQFDTASIVVVDSFTSRFRLNTNFDGRDSLSARNEEFSRHLQALETMATELDCPVLLMCQVYPSPTQYGSRDVIYGSSLMMHMVNYVVKMRSKKGALSNLKIQNHPEYGDFEVGIQILEEGLVYAE